MGVREFELPTKAVDNSVDFIGATALSAGFYYTFVKLGDFTPNQLVI